MEKILVFDTTLRDGEQSPGATMTTQEKVRVAQELDALGVDVIEAGFPVSSPQEFESVVAVAAAVQRPVVVGLARATNTDVDEAAGALQGAAHPRIHTFLATSDLHLERKLKINRDEALRRIERAVARARQQIEDVEFSAEDATRSDLDFLCRAVRVAVEAGAQTINLPDTVGYAHPADIERMLQAVTANVPGIANVVLSVHCHDDLGLAVANSLSGIENGARQVECTLNGIGERAGNASLEEVVMALKVLPRYYDRFTTGITHELLCPASEMLAHVTGIRPQPNKAIVGANAFAHEAGIHQDGLLKDRRTYEIMTPEMVGARGTRLVLGKHSGRHALTRRYTELGYDLSTAELDRAYELFILLADRKKVVHDEDLLAIYFEGTMEDAPRAFKLEFLDVRCGRSPSEAVVRISHNGGPIKEARATGDGPIDAAFSAIEELAPWEIRLEEFQIMAAGGGRDAVGEVHLTLRVGGNLFAGRAASLDVVDAAARAFLNALDKADHARGLEARRLREDGSVGSLTNAPSEARPTELKVAVLGGDGVGPEVTGAAMQVLEAAVRDEGVSLRLAERSVGWTAVLQEGSSLPDGTLRACLAADAVFLGAVGHPEATGQPRERLPETGLLALRKALACWANLRPVRVPPSLVGVSALRPERVRGTDVMILRELGGGLYYGEPRGEEDGRAWNTMVYGEDEVRRIARLGFSLARGRRGRVTSVDKANVLEVSRLWRRVVDETAAEEGQGVEVDHMLVDRAAMELVLNPARFDVLLTENLFGDILSDQAGALVGSLGALGSASLGDGTDLYEPVHGSAPDIAGQGIANPLGAMASVALMLRHTFRMEDAAWRVEYACEAALADGIRTGDLRAPGREPVGTTAFTDAVLERLEATAPSGAPVTGGVR